MQALRLREADVRLLAARSVEHGNSCRRMETALEDAGATAGLERLRALRRLEVEFGLDLGSLCEKYLRRDQPATHPLERRILGWVVSSSVRDDGSLVYTVLVDRVREIRDLIEGRTSAHR